jgi:hypothetical protein
MVACRSKGFPGGVCLAVWWHPSVRSGIPGVPPPPFLTYTSTSTSLPFGATSLVVLRHLPPVAGSQEVWLCAPLQPLVGAAGGSELAPLPLSFFLPEVA